MFYLRQFYIRCMIAGCFRGTKQYLCKLQCSFSYFCESFLAIFVDVAGRVHDAPQIINLLLTVCAMLDVFVDTFVCAKLTSECV